MTREAIGVGENETEALENARQQLGIDDTVQVEIEIIQRAEKKKFGLFGGSPAKVKITMSESSNDTAEQFLKNVLEKMGLSEITVEKTEEEGGVKFNLSGEGVGFVIGRRGETLDSLQYLTSLVVNKGSSSYVRVKLDTENYRERRKATLENLSKNIAVKVKKSRQSVYLEPMNPYERRIIHSALQDDPFVTTHSEGEEPERKVVVTLRKDADLEALERKYGERRSGRGTRGNFHSGRGGHSFDRRGQKRREYGSSAPNTSEDSAGSDTPQSTDE